LAAEVVAAVAEVVGIEKSGGQVALLLGVARPMAEAIVDRDKAIKRMTRAARKHNRGLKQVHKTLAAIGYRPTGVGFPPRRTVNSTVSDWKPPVVAEPARVNGHEYRGVVTDE
jgi:hypothetical protein